MTLFLAAPSVTVRKCCTGREFAVPTAAAVGGGTSTACDECASLPVQR
jgi:hypothetical protein